MQYTVDEYRERKGISDKFDSEANWNLLHSTENILAVVEIKNTITICLKTLGHEGFTRQPPIQTNSCTAKIITSLSRYFPHSTDFESRDLC